VNNSSVAGISSLPNDEPNTVEICADDSQSKLPCNGWSIHCVLSWQLDKAISIRWESHQMLTVVKNEMGNNNFAGLQSVVKRSVSNRFCCNGKVRQNV
jgi:hypothetical protein